jgi:zinc transporter, ZIP family
MFVSHGSTRERSAVPVEVWAAFLWGGFTSASLFIGQALAGPMAKRPRATGLVMAFGAGTLLSAVGYELIPESSLDQGVGIGASFLLGTLVYFFANKLVNRRGGKDRQEIEGGDEGGSGMAMFLGALLDGVPESFVLGIGLALGGSISVAFVTAIFVSNIPQGIAGTTSMQAAGSTGRHVFWMWTTLTVASAVVAALGFLLADAVPDQGLYAEAFAGGAVLTMLANSMMPEAFEHGGDEAGLLTVLGYLVAGALTVIS